MCTFIIKICGAKVSWSFISFTVFAVPERELQGHASKKISASK